MKREKFGSRLGFILISAGCAIGLGNVWRFPYITGQYGGAAFVLIYLFFLLVLGLPIYTKVTSAIFDYLPMIKFIQFRLTGDVFGFLFPFGIVFGVALGVIGSVSSIRKHLRV